MAEKQIFAEINSLAKQAFGEEAITAIDNQGIVSIGDYVLSSSQNTEKFLNSLVQRIGKTIISSRAYKSKFTGIQLDDFQWGAVVQKLKVSMPEAVSDESYNLVDGESVDQWKVSKPKVTQKLFYTDTPWVLKMTFQTVHLEEAFSSAGALESFIGAVYTEIQNKIESSMEQLGRDCIVNFIAEIKDSRGINLLKNYNDETNAGLTVAKAMFDPDFLRYCVETITNVSDMMTEMSKIYNDGTETRHTPKDLQKLFIISKFNRRLETVVEYRAFHDGLVKLKNFESLGYWQDIKTPYEIDVKKASDGTEVKNDSEHNEIIVGALFDRDALGTYKKEQRAASTGVNAAGLYSNTYWHFRNMYFNDLSENGVVFYLAEA